MSLYRRHFQVVTQCTVERDPCIYNRSAAVPSSAENLPNRRILPITNRADRPIPTEPIILPRRKPWPQSGQHPSLAAIVPRHNLHPRAPGSSKHGQPYRASADGGQRARAWRCLCGPDAVVGEAVVVGVEDAEV